MPVQQARPTRPERAQAAATEPDPTSNTRAPSTTTRQTAATANRSSWASERVRPASAPRVHALHPEEGTSRHVNQAGASLKGSSMTMGPIDCP